MAKTPQQRYLEKVVEVRTCACGCSAEVIVRKMHTFPSYVKRFGERRYALGHHPNNKLNKQRFGNKNRWNGGRTRHSDGYIEVNIGGGKYKLEHRLVVEKDLGRELAPDEIVHHDNEVKDDNRRENLELTTRADHVRLHKMRAR